MWRFRVVYLLCLIGAVIFHLIYAAELSWFVLLTVVGLPVLSFLFSLPAMLMTRVELLATPSAQQNDMASLCVSVTNKWFAPAAMVRIRVRCQNTFTGETSVFATQFFYATWNEKQCESIPTKHCGRLVYTVDKAWSVDYLGLFALPVRKALPVACYVYPVPVQAMQVAHVLRKMKQRLVPKHGGGFSEEHELRPYRQGDPISGIHWKLSSKWDETIVREPMETERQRIMISVELKGSPNELDNVLGQLVWLSGALLSRDLMHTIVNPYAPSRSLCSCSPPDLPHLIEYIRSLMQYRAADTAAKPKPTMSFHATKYFVLRADRGANR